MRSPKCPRRWDYTWEALSHIGTLRLFLSCSLLSPSSQCQQLHAALDRTPLGRWTVHLTWLETQNQPHGGAAAGAVPFSMKVPLPRVLVDHGAPLHFVAMDDHIQVKMALLLPVDHPLVADFSSVSDCGKDSGENGDLPTPLSLENDIKGLSYMKEVDFYCKNCSAKLTKRPFRSFVEVPSVNWREAADNWFGACCCSFGGASERLATAYEHVSTCEVDVCAIDTSSVIIYVEDVAGFDVDSCKQQMIPRKPVDDSEDNNDSTVTTVDSSRQNSCCRISSEDIDDTARMYKCLNINEGNLFEDSEAKTKRIDTRVNNFLTVHEGNFFESPQPETKRLDPNHSLLYPSKIDNSGSSNFELHLAQESVPYVEWSAVVAPIAKDTGIYAYADVSEGKSDHIHNLEEQICTSVDCGSSLKGKTSCCVDRSCDKLNNMNLETHAVEICRYGTNYQLHNKSSRFYNGSLGAGFVVRSSSSANSVEWVEFLCFQCSSMVGTYPSVRDQNVPLDDGIRLFKCHISTSSISGGPEDFFRKHTLESLVSNQLLESAVDELSFHTVVRDLITKAPKLQLILLNSEAWCCTGYLWDAENEIQEPGPMPVLQPMIKVLFYDYTDSREFDSRMIEQLAAKKQAEEVYMLTKEVEELSNSLKSARSRLPSSCSFLQGLAVSFMER